MEQLLKVENLRVSYHSYAGEVQSVCGVSFEVSKGETVAVVGESGCGKSVTSKAIMGLIQCPPGEIKEGSHIYFENQDLLSFQEKQWEKYRGAECSMIFQDALTSLNPTMNIGNQIIENITNHKNITKLEAKKEAIRLLELVGIPEPAARIKQYPHELSGGMRQRVMIAIALACNPKLLIADEPTTALDVTIQAQIIDLIKQLQQKLGTSVILITHDLGVVADIAHRIVVMYSGKVVEQGSSEDIFYRPKHPYTWALLKAVPRLDLQNKQQLVSIEGMPPDLITPPVGCPFAERCPHTMKICQTTPPPTYHFEDGHEASCWLHHPQCKKENLPFVAGGGQECQK